MTDLHHPITPPPELVEQWDSECESDVDAAMYLATQAARWGANQELEACCEWLDSKGSPNASRLRAARRPKPPSLKDKALLQLDTLNADLAMHGMGCDLSQIRRAIESLPS